MRSSTITYSQNCEDIILSSIFKEVKNGFYIDIGANHPVNDSVTKKFYLNGWTGINVEPNQDLQNLLIMDRPKDINLKCGVSDKRGVLKFREYSNTGLSTFSYEVKKEFNKKPGINTTIHKDYEVEVLTMNDIFDKVPNGVIVNFLKVDVEGYEYKVLIGNDWDKNRPQILCIEADHDEGDWEKILTKANYVKFHNDGLNDYFVSKENMELVNKFNYIDTFLLGPEIVSWRIKSNMMKLEAYLRAEKLKNSQVVNKIQSKEIGVKGSLHNLRLALDNYFGRKTYGLNFTEKDINEAKTMSTKQAASFLHGIYLDRKPSKASILLISSLKSVLNYVLKFTKYIYKRAIWKN